MIRTMNFKPFNKRSSAIRGFFDLRYHGLTIKGCRLMASVKGFWVALPQQKIEQEGENKYIEQIYLTPPETEHVRRVVLADLQDDFINKFTKVYI